MARMPRVVVPLIPHHITQRGNARRFILASPDERNVYLDLLQQAAALHEVSIIGYSLMSNHVHLVAIPQQPNALAAALKQTHGRYAAFWNARHGSSGHVWQGRFYSCPLDLTHLWLALRYTELNPVRAGLVRDPELWAWSSASAHCGRSQPPPWMHMRPWDARWTSLNWRQYLSAGEVETDRVAIRQCTHTGRPLGAPPFIHSLELLTQRQLTPQPGGRRAKQTKQTGDRRDVPQFSPK